jgi:hypothetical protein
MSDWEKAGSDAIDIKKEVGKEYVGKFVSSNSWAGNFGQSFIYKFVDEKNIPFSIFGFTTLNRFMENIVAGTWVKIIYTGKKKNKKMQDVHTCEVFVKLAEPAIINKQTDDDLPF